MEPIIDHIEITVRDMATACVPQAAASTSSGAFLDGDEIMAAALAAVGSGDVLSIVRDPDDPNI